MRICHEALSWERLLIWGRDWRGLNGWGSCPFPRGSGGGDRVEVGNGSDASAASVAVVTVDRAGETRGGASLGPPGVFVVESESGGWPAGVAGR